MSKTPEAVTYKTLDANEAVARVAYQLSETIAIYPITPSSPMAESCDEWSAQHKPNLWNAVPRVVEMQSEGGAAGALHGMLQVGSLSTTFTASQGLLLMIPELYKIAGELTPFVLHVTARTLATHALSIFGDHSDVMACRQTGCAMLCSPSVQAAQDFALISHAATLRTQVPFLHFFDGFRTSHEINKIALLPESVVKEMIPDAHIAAFRARALSPDAPRIRGTAQNPDAFFQAREAANLHYLAIPGTVASLFEAFGLMTGRHYRLFDYAGHPQADRVIVIMGSGAETATTTAEWLNEQGEKTGVLTVNLFRPFSLRHFLNVLPSSVRSIAVLDRTKEPGAIGEPLYLDIVTALAEARQNGESLLEVEPVVIGGRYGLSSKEFTPAMVRAVFEELTRERPKQHFTIGINDDVTRLSLAWDPEFEIESPQTSRAVFYGLGSDGTVGANKNTIKIIGEETDLNAQGYFVYDSKKSGAVTVSHLRFGPEPIRAPYLIRQANFVGSHQPEFLETLDVLSVAAPGATVLLNSSHAPEKIWDTFTRTTQETILERGLKLYVVDAYRVARECGMGGRINTIMQSAFFALSGVLPREEALLHMRHAIEKTYARKGKEVVAKNIQTLERALDALHAVPLPDHVSSTRELPHRLPTNAPDFVKRVTGLLLAGLGDQLPVSAFPPDGSWPSSTSRWEKRGLALQIPVWETDLCIQCNKCALVCPHAAIRPKAYDPSFLAQAPEGFRSTPLLPAKSGGLSYTLQVAPEDCTGCSLCVEVCPARSKQDPQRKALNLAPLADRRVSDSAAFEYFLTIPDPDRRQIKAEVKSIQFQPPLFEFSGACAGCGETPYVKLLTQMYGDRLFVANATGCSSIYGGNLPTTPWCSDQNGRGPAWSNSLFEDNAEYGFGQRFAIDAQHDFACLLIQKLAPQIGDELVQQLLHADQSTEEGIAAQRQRVLELRARLRPLISPEAQRLVWVANALVRKSVWILGGDGWAYDIGYGGLDHVLALNSKVNILVLDTEVYSNTGGQSSKSTPMGATAKFAAAGKRSGKKDLAWMAMSYGHAYVASIALGARDSQTVKVFAEAESYPGTSLILAYSPCIAHGYPLQQGLDQQKRAVDSGYWPLFRFDPRRTEQGEPALKLDSGAPKIPLSEYLSRELRFQMLHTGDPVAAAALQTEAQQRVNERYRRYAAMAEDRPLAV